MKHYQQNGLIKEIKESSNDLFILKKGNDVYFDDNDDLEKLEIDFIKLYEDILPLVFHAPSDYYTKLITMPRDLLSAGLDSDSAISKDFFSKKISNISDYRFLYYAELNTLLSSISDRIVFTKKSFVEFYLKFCEIQIPKHDKNRNEYIGWRGGEEVTEVFNSLNGFFINAYSMFDLITKLVYEIENIDSKFSSYKRLKSKGILFGEKKKIKLLNKANTIFDKHNSLKIIEILRNELIHNGSWDNISKIFFKFEQSKLTEKWIPFPDFKENGLETFYSRKRFFSQGNKINELLPIILKDFIYITNNTINEIKILTKAHNNV